MTLSPDGPVTPLASSALDPYKVCEFVKELIDKDTADVARMMGSTRERLSLVILTARRMDCHSERDCPRVNGQIAAAPEPKGPWMRRLTRVELALCSACHPVKRRKAGLVCFLAREVTDPDCDKVGDRLSTILSLLVEAGVLDVKPGNGGGYVLTTTYSELHDPTKIPPG